MRQVDAYLPRSLRKKLAPKLGSFGISSEKPGMPSEPAVTAAVERNKEGTFEESDFRVCTFRPDSRANDVLLKAEWLASCTPGLLALTRSGSRRPAKQIHWTGGEDSNC